MPRAQARTGGAEQPQEAGSSHGIGIGNGTAKVTAWDDYEKDYSDLPSDARSRLPVAARLLPVGALQHTSVAQLAP